MATAQQRAKSDDMTWMTEPVVWIGRRGVAALVLALAPAGCSTPHESVSPGGSKVNTPATTSDQAAKADEPNTCVHPELPMLDVPSASATEPPMRIPQPDGWEPTAPRGDIRNFRYMLAEAGASGWDEPRNIAIVTLVPAPDGDTDAFMDFLEDTTKKKVAETDPGATDYVATRTTVCGLIALKTTRRSNTMGAVSTLDVVTEVDGHTYVAQIKTGTELDNTDAQRDAAAIVAGFEVLGVPGQNVGHSRLMGGSPPSAL